VLALTITLVLGGASSAVAVPRDDNVAEAQRIRTQVRALDAELEIASEDYNEARSNYNVVTAKVNETQARLDQIIARQQELQHHLDTRVEGMYRQGPLGALELLLGATTFEQFTTTWDVLRDLNSRDAGAVAELKEARAEATEVRAQLKASQAEAKAEFDVMAARTSEIKRQLAERKRLLAGVEGEIARLEREAEASARQRAAAYYGTEPSNAPKSEVVAIALSKLGSPYRWGASGPDAFDCSGFTMWVYARVGVSLPHSSRAQYSVGQRVSKANLKPGDLVFFGKSRIHHVGIYIGGGNYVHSPHTGDVVKISSLVGRSDYAGACRP
jgi:cell wall-associated NlpC family hydrolase